MRTNRIVAIVFGATLCATMTEAIDWPDDPGFHPSLGIWQPIECDCRAIAIALYPNPDWYQDPFYQAVLWIWFMEAYPGAEPADYIDYATYQYNCHSYLFNNSFGWLSDPSPFYQLDGVPFNGCWLPSATGNVLSYYYPEYTHSCTDGTSQWTGKTGAGFLMRNNQIVYGSLMPTQRLELAQY
jgi:hypothetical protein